MAKKLLIIVKYIILVLLIGTGIYSFTEPLYTPTALPVPADQYDFPEIISHKALTSHDFPGNSLCAIKESLSSTLDGIEVDVRMSKDGILFLYHGDTLEEYTDHQGIPESYNWSVLSRIKYKNSEEKLVSLNDVLSLVGGQKAIFLDIKSPHKIETKIAHKIVDSIKKHKLQETVFVESFNPLTLAIIRLYSRDIMLMYDFTDNTIAYGEEVQSQFDKIPWLLKQHWIQKQIRRIIRPDVLGARFNIAPTVLQHLVKNGYPIISWTVDDPQIAQYLYDSGVKGLQTNSPQTLASVVAQKDKKILDAGGSAAVIQRMINVTTIKDIQEVIKEAKETGKKITIGGRRHSKGGHTLYNQSLFLNMLPFNNVTYHPDTQTVTAESGATWKKVQEVLGHHGRSVKVMQSDNIFTVGGSISANVHGWQVGSPPIGSTILKMVVITSDGKIHKTSPVIDTELFNAVIGGYGMFGVIGEVELETVLNSLVQFHAQFGTIENLDKMFEKKIANPKVELAYARLSVDKENLLNEAGLFWYETKKTTSQVGDIAPEKLVALKRSLFRVSEYHNIGKKLRWQSEKLYADTLAKKQAVVSRNEAMNTDIHVIWPLYGNSKDILQEYFIPKPELSKFVKTLKNNVLNYNVNLLNVTIRDVQKDTVSLLPYAKGDVYGVVCLFSQNQTEKDEHKMKNFTQAVIKDCLALGGTFYLPYRLHYTGHQIVIAYPEIINWVALKKKYDPDFLFQSQFFSYIQNILRE